MVSTDGHSLTQHIPDTLSWVIDRKHWNMVSLSDKAIRGHSGNDRLDESHSNDINGSNISHFPVCH